MSDASLAAIIAGNNDKLAAALAAKDFRAAAALYSEEAKVIPPDGSPVSGRAAIEQFWGGAVAALGLTGARLTTVDLEVSDDESIAWEVGKAALQVGGGTQTVHVNYVVVWKLGKDDVWRLHRDIWNNAAA